MPSEGKHSSSYCSHMSVSVLGALSPHVYRVEKPGGGPTIAHAGACTTPKGALLATRANGPRHTPPPLERQLRKSGAVLGSLIVHITTYLECIRARSRSLLPTALKSERSAHHSCQKTVPTLHANVTFDFSHENRYASA